MVRLRMISLGSIAVILENRKYRRQWNAKDDDALAQRFLDALQADRFGVPSSCAHNDT